MNSSPHYLRTVLLLVTLIFLSIAVIEVDRYSRMMSSAEYNAEYAFDAHADDFSGNFAADSGAPAAAIAGSSTSPDSAAAALPLEGKLFSNPELGLALTVPEGYSVIQNDSLVTVFAPSQGTDRFLTIRISDLPRDAAGAAYASPTDYALRGLGITPEREFTVGGASNGVPAVALTRAVTFSLPNPDARPSASSNIIGYRTYREIYAFKGQQLYVISYFVDDADLEQLASGISFIDDGHPAPVVSEDAIYRPVDTSGWQTYYAPELGFRMKYPPTAKVDNGRTLGGIEVPRVLTLSFDKDSYFSTVFKDDVAVAISVAATCPPLISAGSESAAGPLSDVGVDVLQNATFLRTETDDAAAGNRYQIVTYDALHGDQGGQCYRVIFSVHGANGAGLYADSAHEAAEMQKIHDQELAEAERVFQTMLRTFAFTY